MRTLQGFTVHVNGAGEQLSNLMQTVTGFGPGTSLVDKVKQVQAYLAASKPAKACTVLGDFIDLVRAQTGKTIQPGSTLPSQAGSLTASAQRIKNVIGC